ncbi:hypothetical protein AB9128_10015 [Streptomyces cinereoruber]|uniref:hypothetical protein n=1 Tax=Streptomyces cinereoruber TaxID=67260 RepID=UPI003EB968EC
MTVQPPATTASGEDTGGVRGADTAPFLAVWLPSVVTVIGTGLAVFASGWWISRAPDGGARLGVIVGTASAVSLIAVLVFAGLLDTGDRRRVVVVLLLALLVPLAALVAVFGLRPTGGTVVLAGVCYVAVYSLQQLYMAALENIGADLAPASWPDARTALLTQIHTQVSRALAPLAAGWLLASNLLPVVALIATGCVLCGLGAVHVFRRHIDTARPAPAGGGEPAPAGLGQLRNVLRDAAGSVRLIRGHRELLFLVCFGALANLIVFPFYAVLPAFNAEYGLSVRAQATLYSAASSAYGVGMLAGAAVLVRVRRSGGTAGSLRLATLACAAICGVLLVTTLAPWPGTVVVAMAATGALFAVLVAVGGAVWLRLTPAAVRVRVFGLRRLTVFCTIPLGSMLLGFGGAAFGYRDFTRVVLLFVLVVLAALWFGFGLGRTGKR